MRDTLPCFQRLFTCLFGTEGYIHPPRPRNYRNHYVYYYYCYYCPRRNYFYYFNYYFFYSPQSRDPPSTASLSTPAPRTSSRRLIIPATRTAKTGAATTTLSIDPASSSLLAMSPLLFLRRSHASSPTSAPQPAGFLAPPGARAPADWGERAARG